jgi:hypothetical protein
MSLADEGALSFGGTVVNRSINLELRRAGNATLNLNDSEARIIANIIPALSEISIYDFYGKSYYVFGQQVFTGVGVYDWICPESVRSVSVVCIGGGGGGSAGPDVLGFGSAGGGGSLAYRNNIPVIPGETYQIVVGAGGDNHVVLNGTTVQVSSPGQASSAFSCIAGGGAGGSDVEGGEIGIQSSSGGSGGQRSGIYDGGGDGGAGGKISTAFLGYRLPGGGGTGGYNSNGGKGADGVRPSSSPSLGAGQPGTPGVSNTPNLGRGGGGGGSAFITSNRNQLPTGKNYGGGGGGNSLLGYDLVNLQSSGVGGQGQALESFTRSDGTIGTRLEPPDPRGSAGLQHGNITPFHGIGGGGGYGAGEDREGRVGQPGAVRIIWPGNLRRFPDLSTGNA